MNNDVITPLDDNAQRAFDHIASRERLSDPHRRAAVLAHRRHQVEAAEDQVKSIECAIAAATIALQQLEQSKQRAIDVLVDKQEDLKLAEDDEARYKAAA